MVIGSQINDMKTNASGKLYLATNNGLYVFDETAVVTGIKTTPNPTTAANITVYPNPANHFIEISTADAMIDIFDNVGKKVLHQTNSDRIDISQLTEGIYLIRIEVGGQISNQKLIVKK